MPDATLLLHLTAWASVGIVLRQAGTSLGHGRWSGQLRWLKWRVILARGCYHRLIRWFGHGEVAGRFSWFWFDLGLLLFIWVLLVRSRNGGLRRGGRGVLWEKFFPPHGLRFYG